MNNNSSFLDIRKRINRSKNATIIVIIQDNYDFSNEKLQNTVSTISSLLDVRKVTIHQINRSDVPEDYNEGLKGLGDIVLLGFNSTSPFNHPAFVLDRLVDKAPEASYVE